MCSKQRKFLCFTVFLIIFTVSVNEPSAHICAVCFQLWHNFVLRLCIQYAEKKHKQTHRKHANCEQLKINDRILMGKFGKKNFSHVFGAVIVLCKNNFAKVRVSHLMLTHLTFLTCLLHTDIWHH